MMNLTEKNMIILRFNGLFIILWPYRYTPIMAYAEKIIYGIRNLFKKSENRGHILQNIVVIKEMWLKIVFTCYSHSIGGKH